MSQFFTAGGQSIRASALASVLPMNIQGWFPLGFTGLIFLQYKWLSRVFSITTIQKHLFFSTVFFMVQLSDPFMTTGKTTAKRSRNIFLFLIFGLFDLGSEAPKFLGIHWTTIVSLVLRRQFLAGPSITPGWGLTTQTKPWLEARNSRPHLLYSGKGRGTGDWVNHWSCLCDEVKWSESCSVMSNSLWPHGLYSPWNSLGQNTGVGSLSLLQGIFPNQGLNPGLLHCRGILYQLSHKGSLCDEASIKKPKIQSWESFRVDEYIQVLRGWHTPNRGRQTLVYSELSCTLLYISLHLAMYLYH